MVMNAYELAPGVYAGLPISVLIFLAVALLGAFLTQNTTFGRYLFAIGGNPDAARLSGISIRKHILMVFCVMGALTGCCYYPHVPVGERCAGCGSPAGIGCDCGVRDRRNEFDGRTGNYFRRVSGRDSSWRAWITGWGFWACRIIKRTSSRARFSSPLSAWICLEESVGKLKQSFLWRKVHA